MRALLVLLFSLASACAPRMPAAPTWQGTPAEIPHSSDGSYFAPSEALQFLVDPYPAPEGPSWLGADVGTSIRVSEDRYIWIFGDTLLGAVRDHCPDDETYCDRKVDHGGERIGMIRNTAGVSERGDDGSFRRVVKYWPTRDGDPHDTFASGVEGQFLWPLAGVRAGEPVLIVANRHTPESGLAPVGNVILRIANPDADPPDWKITRHELPNFRAFDGPAPSLVWTMAIVHLGRHAYIFGERGSAFDAETVLARVAVADVTAADWAPKPEYLMRTSEGDLQWSHDFEVDRLHVVRGLPGTSETTVNYDPAVGWYSYQLPPLDFDVYLYTAPDLEGPWRNSGVVYRLPAPWSTTRNEACPDGAITCMEYIAYAVKAHPELAPPGGRVLTYNVNLGSGSLRGAELAAERVPGFYVPQMVVGPNGGPSHAAAVSPLSPESALPRPVGPRSSRSTPRTAPTR